MSPPLKQEKQKYYFDQHTKHLPVLEKGDRMRVHVCMGNLWEAGVVVDHEETSRLYTIQTVNDGEYCRNRKMLMKLPDDGLRLSTDNSPVHCPPSERVNGSSPYKEQVNQVTPVAEEPVSVFVELMATRKHQSNARLDVDGSNRDLYA